MTTALASPVDALDLPFMKRLHSGAYAAVPSGTTLAVDPVAFTITAVISAKQQDRAGDIVLPTGLANRAEYLANPVVLWAHDRTSRPPIGQCIELNVDAERIVAVTKFAQGNPHAEDVFRLYEQGILRAWSIGFLPKKLRPLPERADGRRGLLIEEWDLLEYSAVPIPENPAALTMILRKGLLLDADFRVELRAGVPDILAELY